MKTPPDKFITEAISGRLPAFFQNMLPQSALAISIEINDVCVEMGLSEREVLTLLAAESVL